MDDVNNVDADARLPPRKRLLAGLKKHNGDGDGSGSPPSPLSLISSDMSNRLRDLLNDNNIVDASRSAAVAAVEAAVAARAVAEEKAAMAAKAVAAAKDALELVGTFSVKKSRKEKSVWNDKLKKHVPVQVLYKKKRKRGETDEELARKLHRVINSSPRIMKSGSTGSDPNQNRRKHRKKINFEITANANGGSSVEGKLSNVSDINVEKNDTMGVNDMVKLEDKAKECMKTDGLEMEALHTNGDAEASQSTAQTLEDSVRTNRKRGRIKQKKLFLSQCTNRDRETTKEEPKSAGLKSVKDPNVKVSITVDPLLSVEPSTEVEVSQEAASTRQHKELTTPQCYGGSNILRSLCSNPAVSAGAAMIEVDQ